MKVKIATYTTGQGDSFVDVSMDGVFHTLSRIHGGQLVDRKLDKAGGAMIWWIDSTECQFVVEVAEGELYGMGE